MRYPPCLRLCLVVLATLAVPAGPLRAQEAVGSGSSDAELEVIDARMAAIEQALLQAQGDRFRSRHGLLYEGSPEIAAERVEVKQLEKSVIDLKRAHRERVRVLDEAYRRLERDLARLHGENRERAALVETIGNEIALAEVDGEEAERLRQEQQDARDAITANLVRIQQIEVELGERVKQVNANDQQAGALAADLDSAEAVYAAAYTALHAGLEGSEALKDSDDRRHQLARELQQLRQQRNELLRSMPAPDPGTP